MEEWAALELWEVNQDHSKCQVKLVQVLELDLEVLQVQEEQVVLEVLALVLESVLDLEQVLNQTHLQLLEPQAWEEWEASAVVSEV